MAYFKIGNNDYSTYVNKLKVDTNSNYTSQTNAAGDTVVDYINKKRTIEVGIIPLTDTEMKQLQADLDAFNVKLTFRNPRTGSLESNVNCIIPSSGVDYYTIQANKVLYNAFSLTFIEL